MNYKSSTCSMSRVLVLSVIVLSSCGGDGSDPKPTPPPGPTAITITIDPAVIHQEMIGFGGALTWYSNWMTSSSNKNAMADLIFDDLGIDIIRFKNWYYPDGYPGVTSTAIMTDDNSKVAWDATNELYTMAKNRNPNVKILLSSWGPPAALKSNNSSREGTLKKDGAGFMYDAFADYWGNVLDHVPFNPDYISIQNEPTFTNAGWTTCKWAAVETTDLADYHIAFDKVYDKIKDRTNVPVMIGPESQDIPTFSAFANVLKNKAHCGAFAYHPYNINEGNASQMSTSLATIGSFTTKPNIMTEFSDNLSWFNTASFIQNALVKANSSGYIYWKLVWSTPSTGTNAGMVSVNSAGAYVVTPYFHLIKHFSKNIDKGYTRVDASSSSANLNISAFKNPTTNKLTVIVINGGSSSANIKLTATGKTISGIEGYQSKEGSYYKTLTNLLSEDSISLPAKTITTFVLNI